MLVLKLKNLGKRFNRHWIFRRVNFEFQTGTAYAITGPNGSGKSTLLQVIAGAMEQSEGKIELQESTTPKESNGRLPENFYASVALAAPYLELIEELTLHEFFEFHFRFKPILSGYSVNSLIDYINLQDASGKQIRYFSSGMKQRVKLAQAFFSDTALILLDEPTTNLDTKGIELYQQMVKQFSANRILVVCSNDEQEISFCQQRLLITDFK